MKKITAFIVFVWPVLTIFSQEQRTLSPLKIGDSVHNVILENLMNHPTKSENLYGFNGKLIILDFWSTWCTACMAAFPYLDSLKKEFGSSLDIILVNAKSKETGDSDDKIRTAVEKLSKRTGIPIMLPIVVDCPSLDTLFPSRILPHEVWIKDRKVVAITGSRELTRNNIRAVLAGNMPAMRMKQDIFLFNDSLPLYVNGNGGTPEKIKYRSLLTPYIEGLGGKAGYRTACKTVTDSDCFTGVFAFNQSILSLLRPTMPQFFDVPNNRIINESEKFNVASSSEGDLYCYDLVTPPISDSVLRAYVIDDLFRFFPLKVSRESRETECWILQSRPHRQNPDNSAKRGFELQANSRNKFICGLTAREAEVLFNRYLTVPFITETRDNRHVNVDLPYDLSNFEDMAAAFKKAGYLLKKETRFLDMTVISDR